MPTKNSVKRIMKIGSSGGCWLYKEETILIYLRIVIIKLLSTYIKVVYAPRGGGGGGLLIYKTDGGGARLPFMGRNL